MSDDWENEDFEPTIPAGGTASDKWQGEDEDDDVKDNWEDEDEEEKKADSTTETTAYQRPKKKPLAERIAEKERLKQEEEKHQEQQSELSTEQKLAQKIRIQKIQEESDLKLAKGLFEGDASGGIDGMYPETKEGFDQLGDALKSKITFFEGSTLYSAFVEKLLHEVSLTLPVEDIKKIGISLNSLYHEKERQRKEQAKNKKKKVKATIRVEKDDLGLADGGTYYDDDDDFI